jgi:EAL and modified HD-GYP domain-containing signal transduction protein
VNGEGAAVAARPAREFLIGRQPIVDREANVYAYELLFRDPAGIGAEAFGSTEASNRVIVDALLEHGLERLVGRHRAFINFTRENLLSGTALLLPKDRVVVEILESVEIDAPLAESVCALADQGYTIALDDFVFHEKWLPLLSVASIVKIDVRQSSPEDARALMRRLSRLPLRYLAEKVENPEEHRAYRELGCDYFQGFLFSKPSVIQGRRLEASQAAAMHLLAQINDPRLSIGQLAETISLDAGLSYKLLRYVNSAALSLPRKVSSIKQAATLLGLAQIRRLASLIALGKFPEKQRETVNLALIRARACENLTAAAQPGADAGQAFLTGLMSAMDRLLGSPLDEALSGLPLAPEVLDALLLHRGTAGAALGCALAYEDWNLDAACFADLPLAEIGRIYLESVAWAYEAVKALEH